MTLHSLHLYMNHNTHVQLKGTGRTWRHNASEIQIQLLNCIHAELAQSMAITELLKMDSGSQQLVTSLTSIIVRKHGSQQPPKKLDGSCTVQSVLEYCSCKGTDGAGQITERARRPVLIRQLCQTVSNKVVDVVSELANQRPALQWRQKCCHCLTVG